MEKLNRLGHELAYVVWDADSPEELKHLKEVFRSCVCQRKDQLRTMQRIYEKEGLRVEYHLLDDRLVDISED